MANSWLIYGQFMVAVKWNFCGSNKLPFVPFWSFYLSEKAQNLSKLWFFIFWTLSLLRRTAPYSFQLSRHTMGKSVNKLFNLHCILYFYYDPIQIFNGKNLCLKAYISTQTRYIYFVLSLTWLSKTKHDDLLCFCWNFHVFIQRNVINEWGLTTVCTVEVAFSFPREEEGRLTQTLNWVAVHDKRSIFCEV